MKLALYRKYRPQHFDDLVGQSNIRTTLLEALKQGRLTHAYMFTGPRGTGKTSTARLIARAIQCESPQESGQACGTCNICQMSALGELIDLVEIDAASNRGIDEIRDLREKIRFAPTYAKSKVYIIDEVHMLTKEAFNALLKSLEEPPANVYFILATTEVHKIPETILSRCQRYDFRRIAREDLVNRLETIAKAEGLQVEREALELIAHHADGGMRDAISTLEQLSSEALTLDMVRERLGLSSHHAVEELYGILGRNDTQAGLKLVDQLHEEGNNLREFTTAFLAFLRGKVHEAVAHRQDSVVTHLLKWVDLFDAAWIKLKSASIAQLPLEIAIIRATQHAPVQETLVTEAQPKRKEGLLHVDTMQEKLVSIASAIQDPKLRISFKSGHVKNVEGKQVHLTFGSDFHFDTVHKAEAILDIEAAFKTVLGSEHQVLIEKDLA